MSNVSFVLSSWLVLLSVAMYSLNLEFYFPVVVVGEISMVFNDLHSFCVQSIPTFLLASSKQSLNMVMVLTERFSTSASGSSPKK